MTNILSYNTLPAMMVYLNTPVTNVTGNGTTYTVLFDTVVPGFSIAGYDIGTGIYTVSVAGNYLISTNLLLNNIINGANGNLCLIRTEVGDFRISEYAMTAAKDPSNIFSTNGARLIKLDAGNTIRIFAQLNNGSVASVGLSGGSAPYNTWFYVKYLG